ncbi:MAG: DUF4097 family beta strand repeat-containing protein [Candidatus Eisenbacteria bacterium]
MDRQRYFVPLLAAFTYVVLAHSPVRSSERFVLAGDDVRIWNLAGSTVIEPATGDHVIVLVERAGADAPKLRIATDPVRGHAALRVLYGNDRVVYQDRAMRYGSTSSVQIRDDGTWGSDGARKDWWKGMGRRVTVSNKGFGMRAHADLRVQVPKGHRVSVYTVAGAATLTHVDGRILFDGGATDVTANDCAGALSVDIGSGSVSVNKFDGDLSVDTGSGHVGLTDVAGTSLSVDTGSGDVNGIQLAARDILVDTGSGSVDLASVHAASLKVDTGSGSVDLSLLSSRCALDVDTGSGSVRITVPPNFAADVDIETGSGGIRSDLPMTVIQKDSDQLRARIGSGGARLHVDTGSGGVALVKSR